MLQGTILASGIFKGVTSRFDTTEKRLFLSLDDGPTEHLTGWILDQLDQYGAKGTFFCLGSQAERFREQYHAIIDRGHATGNHTHNHLKGWFTGGETYVKDVIRAGKFIDSALFRPPHGLIRPSQIYILREQYHIVLWDVMSGDYRQRATPEKIIRHVTRRAKPGSVVVFHDSRKAEKNLKEALPMILEYFDSKGYVFLPLTAELPAQRTLEP